MTFRLRQISQTADGREIVRVSERPRPVISIGRASDCDVHLADLAVEPLQAIAETGSDGFVTINAAGTLGFSVDGRVTTQARVDSAKGAELGFGGHRITIARDEDGAVALTVRRVESISESAAEMDSGRDFSLTGALPAKRIMAWAFFLCILAAFLAVPVVSNFTRAAGPKAQVTGDESWSSGPLSAAHHALEGECTACHVKPFEAVRDSACKSCHQSAHDHAAPALLARARQTPGLGGQFLLKVAHGFGKPGPGACVDCHTEHDGAGPMQPVKQAFCADCHAGLDARLPDSALGDAGDFGTSHPQFRALVATDTGRKPRFERISLDRKPVDANGLAFSHGEHLATRGTVARMAGELGADGYGKPLECSNCHRPTADGVRFLPVNMERDCEACHSLAYDKVGGTVRRLHYGDFAQMVADLRAAERGSGASAVLGQGLSGRERPGTPYGAHFGRPTSANLPLMQAVSSSGVCGECHMIDRTAKDVSAWQVQPVHQTARYFENGWFDHKAHEQERCTSCHGATRSTKASDLLLPDIKQCRTCHMGETAARAKVPSSCAMCHDYHQDAGAPWAIARNDRRKTLLASEMARAAIAGRQGAAR